MARTGRFALPVFLVAGLLAGISVPGIAQAPVSTSVPQELRTALSKKLGELKKQAGFPGATLGLTFPDGSSIGLAVGHTDTAGTRPLMADALMLQGSVGKTYFAAVALQLVKAGSLQLDARVSTYLSHLPWFKRVPNAAEITVRMLMNHTSGIVRYEFNPKFLADLRADPHRTWSVADRLAYVLDSEPPFAAGKGWTYSDTNYILLGAIIEKLTGKKAYDEIRRRLLQPLHLKHTVPSDRRVIKGLVQGWAGAENDFTRTDAVMAKGALVVNPQLEWAGGGFASSAQDMARWARAYFEGRAFDKTLLKDVLNGVEVRKGSRVRYGLATMIRQTPHGVSYGHNGFFPGFMSEMRYYVNDHLTVAIQINTSDRNRLRQSTGALLDAIVQVVQDSKSSASKRDK